MRQSREAEELAATETTVMHYFTDLKGGFKRHLRDPKFFLEVLALVGLVFYSYETRRTNDLTQTALRNNQENFRRDERPYVWFTNDLGPFFVVPADEGKLAGRLAFTFHFTDYGKSPAINVQEDAHIAYGDDAESKIGWNDLDGKGSIMPPTNVAFNSAFTDDIVDPQLLIRLNTKGLIQPVIVWGHFQYFDIDGTRYTSEFCLGHAPNGAINYCKNHNQISEGVRPNVPLETSDAPPLDGIMRSSAFAASVIAGLVSGVVILVCLELYKWYRDWKTFSPMSGDYEECEMPDGKPTSGTIKIKSKRSLLRTQGVKEDGRVLWAGTIHMNPLSPNVGNGVYRYLGARDCGTHQVQRDPETDDFIVFGSNTSHPDGKERFNMLWRRKRGHADINIEKDSSPDDAVET